MILLERLLQHHVLANLTFVLVLVMGTLSYFSLPKEKDPTINFNWIQINTFMPGASPEDIEKRVTQPLEEGIARVSDIRFISSTSRASMSSIIVRFEDISERLFDKRLADLRREIQYIDNARLPEEADSPFIIELTSSSAFPTATLVIQGKSYDDNLRFYARELEKEMERQSFIQRVDLIGASDPELIVDIDMDRLTGLGLSPAIVAQTVKNQFRDSAAGTINIQDQQWLIRIIGTSSDPEKLAQIPVLGVENEVLLGDVASIYMGQERLKLKASYHNQPAIMLSVFKKDKVNTLRMIADLKHFIAEKNRLSAVTGVRLIMVDDNTQITRKAISIMQNNALIGLTLVLLVTWLFLGSRIAFFTTIGIPFTLAGTFWLLNAIGQTLNNAVLLGIVIALGMLVDDAIVVVESMNTRLQKGINATRAAIESLQEVMAPVTSSVLTTIAAFLPLMLLPGIVGEFMLVIPLVVTIALLISLLEAYWMLPAHIIATTDTRLNFQPARWRSRFTHSLQWFYTRLLVRSLRHPKLMLMILLLLFSAAIYALQSGRIKIDFFAGEPFPVFYANVQMPEGTPVDLTLQKIQQLEAKIKQAFERDDYREIFSFAGIYFTQTEAIFGEHLGQIMISLPDKLNSSQKQMHQKVREQFKGMTGVKEMSILQLEDGPPVARAISIKVQGAEFKKISAALVDLKKLLLAIPELENLTVVDNDGSMELALQLNQDAVHRAGISPAALTRDIRILAEGERVSSFQYRGEEVFVRVKADEGSENQNTRNQNVNSIENWLQTPIAYFDKQSRQVMTTPLQELLHTQYHLSRTQIRHHNLQRVVLVEADIRAGGRNSLQINELIQKKWHDLKIKHPDVSLDFSGELDDIGESLAAMPYLFLMGVGLIYLIIGTQFKSYFQPLLILATIPLAFTGVLAGLFITSNPLSIYTLYGIVALVGIAVNASIVLISAANTRLRAGMSVNHAIIYAARRRIIAILITSLTTIAGLFSLASGFAGKSLIWGPLATAIVWGLAFSSLLTLFVIPLLYKFFMKGATRV